MSSKRSPTSWSATADSLIKRGLDVVLSLAVIVITLPLWPVVGALIKLDSRGPVLYRATRIGKDGHPFTLLKFRSMIAASNPTASRVTHRGDPRITRVGRWLRDLKVDEVPQFINVLRGDMSLVGPRPEDPRYVALYTEEQLRVLSVRPGIVGPAVIKYRHEERLLAAAGESSESYYVNELLPAKLRIDLDYVEGRSLWRDLRILAEGVRVLFAEPPPNGAGSPKS
jgi:lipopolysaccharide/colanic/teichoic acid biosynthesis glycosyltransferase